MTDPQPAVRLQTAKASVTRPGQVLIEGRCVHVRRAGQSWAHLVVQPAQDRYSYPHTLLVLSDRRLAEKDEDISVLCEVRGRRRAYQQVDEYGERRTVVTADVSLWAVHE